MEKRVVLGKHLIAEFWVKNPRLLDDPDVVRDGLLAACRKGKFSIVNLDVHEFSPHGVTGVALLAESHLSIHTWPEHGYAAVDIFTCDDFVKPEKAAELLVEKLGTNSHSVIKMQRGIL